MCLAWHGWVVESKPPAPQTDALRITLRRLISMACLFSMTPVLWDHCYERPPAYKEQMPLAKRSTFQCNKSVTKHHLFWETTFLEPTVLSSKRDSTVPPCRWYSATAYPWHRTGLWTSLQPGRASSLYRAETWTHTLNVTLPHESEVQIWI